MRKRTTNREHSELLSTTNYSNNMDIDEELLEEDDVDADYNLDNETENALLEDDGEASLCSKDERGDDNEADPEDVLDLEANEVELNEEEDDSQYKYNSSQDDGQKSGRHDKFSSERNNVDKSESEANLKSLPPKKVANVNNNRQFQRTRGRIKGGRGFHHRKEGRKVLINPHFKGNVQVPNGTARLYWDSQKNANNNERYPQQPFKPNVGTIQPWITPLPVSQQNYVPPPSVNIPPPVNVPVLQETMQFQQVTNWNQCNLPNNLSNNFPPQVNRNVPVHQRLGFTNNFNQQNQLVPPPAPIMQPVYQNNFTQPPPPQYVPQQFTTPPPPLNHPPVNQQNVFYNSFEPPNPNYNNQYQMQPPIQQQVYNQPLNQQQVYNQPPNQQLQVYDHSPNYQNSFKPTNVIRNTYKQLPKIRPLLQKNYSKRNYDSKMFDQRKKKRFVAQNLHEVQTVGETRIVREIRQIEEQPQETVSSEQEEDEETREYRKMIEKQKEAREKILKAKEARRMLTLKTGEPPEMVAPAPAELVKKFETTETTGIRTKSITMQVHIQNSKCNNKSERVVAFTKTDENTKDDVSSFSSSFLSNRKVLCKDQFLPETPLVVIKDLASGTTEVKLYKLCSGIGDVQKLQLSKEERQATIQFKSVASAHAFYKKYQRYMLDLSMIQVTLKPID